jgi:branched-subunit amino acid transport protein
MSPVWAAVVLVGAGTICLKAVGPVLLGGRTLPDWVNAPIGLLAPAVLAALVVTQVVGGERELVLDERMAGLAVAVSLLLVRAPLLVVIFAAALVTALARAL